jgi:hypothetical protein
MTGRDNQNEGEMKRKYLSLTATLGGALWLLSAAGLSASGPDSQEARLKGSMRETRNGWIHVRLEGKPRDVGFQHGWLLAPEIDDTLKALSLLLENSAKRDWAFFREAAGRMFWPRLDPEYREEIEGIAEGLKARLPGTHYDKIDLTALNGWLELASYYVPYLEGKLKTGSGASRAPGSCSAFIATGRYTEDGRIVMGHNNWVDYIIGERWNVILDIRPEKGYRIIMDALPGYIHSGDDFVVNGAGLVYTETTIDKFKGFQEDGIPEFGRARKAAQYAGSIDDFIRIMTTDGNGAYANDWLVGDIKTNEIARLELGLKNHRVWRTTDGYLIGSNFPSDEKLIAEETTFDPKDMTQGTYVRKARWEWLMEENKGKINIEAGKRFEEDHVDSSTGVKASNGNVLCGHIENDPRGWPPSWAPYCPAGAVQGKVTSAALAKDMKFWARMGHPCGEDFIAGPFFVKHPEYEWQKKYLKDMKSHPWTLFEAQK